VEFTATKTDWNAADPALLASMLAQLQVIRAFEETVLELASEGSCTGPRTRASAGRAARSAWSPPCATRTRSTAPTAGTISFWPIAQPRDRRHDGTLGARWLAAFKRRIEQPLSILT
jgi:hypothetical protein